MYKQQLVFPELNKCAILVELSMIDNCDQLIPWIYNSAFYQPVRTTSGRIQIYKKENSFIMSDEEKKLKENSFQVKQNVIQHIIMLRLIKTFST